MSCSRAEPQRVNSVHVCDALLKSLFVVCATAGMQLQPEMARQFAGLVQGLLMQSMEWLASALEAATTPGSTTSDTPILSAPAAAAAGSDEASAAAPATRGGAQGILLLACAARSFEQKNLRECLDGFVRALPSRDQLSALGVDLGKIDLFVAVLFIGGC